MKANIFTVVKQQSLILFEFKIRINNQATFCHLMIFSFIEHIPL